eukprot:1160349-Pelagomonas_calceolata.AAC.6
MKWCGGVASINSKSSMKQLSAEQPGKLGQGVNSHTEQAASHRRQGNFANEASSQMVCKQVVVAMSSASRQPRASRTDTACANPALQPEE